LQTVLALDLYQKTEPKQQEFLLAERNSTLATLLPGSPPHVNWLAVDYGQALASFGGDGDDPAAWRSISSAREEQGVARAGRRERTEN
jgi:hypothetical protein